MSPVSLHSLPLLVQISVFPPFPPKPTALDLQRAFTQLSKGSDRVVNLEQTIHQLTATTARMLDVERASLWGLRSAEGVLECIDLYELSRNRHSNGAILRATDFPEYFKALARGEPMTADDAMTHPASQEFANDYLLMNGISAFINAPIHVNGELQGLLCVERVGPHSTWTSVQRLFTHAVANLVSLALVQTQLALLTDELRDAEQLWRTLFASARDAILISDAGTGDILDANPQAERLFGGELQRLLGALQHGELKHNGKAGDVRAHGECSPGNEPCGPVRAELIRSDGRLIPVEVTGQVVQLRKGRRVVQNVSPSHSAKTRGREVSG